MQQNVGETDAEIHDNIQFYTDNIEGLTAELTTLRGMSSLYIKVWKPEIGVSSTVEPVLGSQRKVKVKWPLKADGYLTEVITTTGLTVQVNKEADRIVWLSL